MIPLDQFPIPTDEIIDAVEKLVEREVPGATVTISFHLSYNRGEWGGGQPTGSGKHSFQPAVMAVYVHHDSQCGAGYDDNIFFAANAAISDLAHDKRKAQSVQS